MNWFGPHWPGAPPERTAHRGYLLRPSAQVRPGTRWRSHRL